MPQLFCDTVRLVRGSTIAEISTRDCDQVLMQDCLVLAYRMGVDVFNALDIMENKGIFSDLKFGPGDGHLQVRHRDVAIDRSSMSV